MLEPLPNAHASHFAWHVKRSHSIFDVSVVWTFAAFLACACVAPERGTVGARFGRDADGHVYVREAPENLGAAKAGMQPGDEVILIEGRDVRPLTDDDIHVILSGERGTPVRLTVLRGDEVLRLSVERTPPPRPGASSTASTK